jgi:haloacetate dehalogenase
MFDDFITERVAAGGIGINVCRGGDGPPVLLLHGYPQTHVMWHRVAARLAERFTVVCADLRGYGDSDKPPGGRDHAEYAKRAMATDQLEVMRALGFNRFALAGHDRGARVALRLALDHPAAVSHLAVLDIVPTATIYQSIDKRHGTDVWRYFFLIQPADLPEHLIGCDPRWYLRRTLHEWCGTPDALSEAAIAQYERCFDAASVHASCEDYRAGASIDLTHDVADADRRLSCPTLVLYSREGIGASYDVPGTWRQRAPQASCQAMDCGHFLAEERPAETAEALLRFLIA